MYPLSESVSTLLPNTTGFPLFQCFSQSWFRCVTLQSQLLLLNVVHQKRSVHSIVFQSLECRFSWFTLLPRACFVCELSLKLTTIWHVIIEFRKVLNHQSSLYALDIRWSWHFRNCLFVSRVNIQSVGCQQVSNLLIFDIIWVCYSLIWCYSPCTEWGNILADWHGLCFPPFLVFPPMWSAHHLIWCTHQASPQALEWAASGRPLVFGSYPSSFLLSDTLVSGGVAQLLVQPDVPKPMLHIANTECFQPWQSRKDFLNFRKRMCFLFTAQFGGFRSMQTFGLTLVLSLRSHCCLPSLCFSPLV